MHTKRINLISTPRNISTALMYSFASRKDSKVVDEPMYAYYLHNSGAMHPGREAILEALPKDFETVKNKLLFQEMKEGVYFIKGMAHHYLDLDLGFLKNMENVFLIRDPQKLIISFSKVISNPTMTDIGVKKEFQIFSFLQNENENPIVLDSEEVLKNPAKVLAELCAKIEIPFAEDMLQWKSGPIEEDGVWAEHWYGNVHKSTGFNSVKRTNEKFPHELMSLYEEAMPYYEKLLEYSIKA